MMKGHIFDIKRYAIHDGPGIRVTVFLQGCPLDCWWCHNPEGREKGLEGGREMGVEELLREVEKDIVFMEELGGGVTVSGGEPLHQPEFLGAFLDACRNKGLHVTLDTCGYAPAEVFDSVMDRVDLFYYDLKFIDDELHVKFTGVSNGPVLRNLKKLDQGGKDVVIRFPVIPTITATEENVDEVGRFLFSLRTIKTLDLLPYHKTAEGKYIKLGLANRARDLEPPSTEKMTSIRDRLQKLGLHVSVGGSR